MDVTGFSSFQNEKAEKFGTSLEKRDGVAELQVKKADSFFARKI